MPTDRRRRKLAQLKGLAPLERGLLANARCLSEGVDVPSLDGVAFIDPRSSQIDIIQAVGRAIRLSPNKKAGTIVVPVFIEDGDSAEESIEASNFKPIWDVLNALKAHDDVLSAEMDQIRTEMGRKTGSRVGAFSKIQVDLPVSVSQSFGDALRTQLVEHATESWEYWYGALEEYAQQHGHCLVPGNFRLQNGFRLGQWVASQRAARDKWLSSIRISRLEALNGWFWSAIDEQWEIGFRHLLAYVAEHGNCLVPQYLKSSDEYRTGQWVGEQRKAQQILSQDRRARLEALPGWTWNSIVERWEIGFRHLQEYVAVHGNCFVSQKMNLPNGYRLGLWVREQRIWKRRHSSEQRGRLEALPNWSWTLLDDQWEKGFRSLEGFAVEHGHCFVPKGFKLPDGYALGQWVGEQRKNATDGLSTERRNRLEALQGWVWRPTLERWEQGFRHLADYAGVHGNCRVPLKYRTASGYPLGQWARAQRDSRKPLQEDQRSRLETLTGWSWNLLDERWENGLHHLQAYLATTGHASPPLTFVTSDGYKLGVWVGYLRYRKSLLPEYKVSALESLSGWMWDAGQASNP